VSPELATRLIDVLGALLLFTMILILGAGQLYRAIYAVAAQSVLIALAGVVLGAATGNVDLFIVAGITLVVKAIGLPWLLLRVIRRVGVRREIEAVVPITATLAVAAGIVVLAFRLSSSLGAVRQAITVHVSHLEQVTCSRSSASW
jgi:hydrogenase-4 component E